MQRETEFGDLGVGCCRGGAGTVDEAGERVLGRVGDAELGIEATNGRRSDPLEGEEDPVPGQLVGGVLEDAELGEQVFDVGRLELAESAVFHERNVAAG